MKSKLQVQLEEAYQLVLEGKGIPCPCTMGKKCSKKGCECKACHKSLKESHGEDHMSDPQMQAGLAILNQYAEGAITNTEAAKMFKDLYEKGAGHGPTQDDMHYTKTE